MCASGGLGASGALASAFKGVERGGLDKFNLGRLVELAYQSLLVAHGQRG